MRDLRCVLPAVVIAFGTSGLRAQNLATFEVASIKPHVSADPGSENSSTNVSPGGRLTGRNVTARKLLRNAFVVEDSWMTGAPGWVDSESYDIDAKTAGGVEINRDNISQLMESLLVSRFAFQYHREPKEVPAYALEVLKSGPVLKPHTGDGGPSMSTNSRSGTVTFKAAKCLMKDFAATLTRQVGRPVEDKTGLAGEFDFELVWSSDMSADGAGPSIFTALQGLGLRLAPTKGSIQTLVIDHIERPSEN